MRAYELMVIFSGDLDDGGAQAMSRQIIDQIAAKSGRVVGPPDWWGRRRFAYEINHKWDGHYAVYNVLAPGGALDDLERFLRIADEVVRHKLIRLPDHEAARRNMVAADAAG